MLKLRGSSMRMVAVCAFLAVAAGLGACSATEELDPGEGGSSSVGGEGGAGTSGGGDGAGGSGMAGPCDDVVCDAGEVCHQGACVPGCSPTEPCPGGLSCCGDICVDVATDLEHCGQCGKDCPQPANMAASCEMGVCQVGACDLGFNDCDGMTDNGCETMGDCFCNPGEPGYCYPGPPGTEGVGPCAAGTRTCNATGTAWSLCHDFVLPSPELCANGIDEDCNGVVDDVPDIDGDGWTACQNDCCETAQDCSNPSAVNPGAFEFVGNGIDDDCDPATSDSVAAPLCSSAAVFTGVTPTQMAQAMDLCQFTTANPPLPQKKWGVINASFRLANGNNPSAVQLSNMQNYQAAVLQNYGTGGVVPQKGATMAGISTGRMRDQNDPNYVNPNSGTGFSSTSQPPSAYLAAHGGSLPSSQGCSGSCPSGSGANDSVNLRLQIRVPTNAQSFSYQFRFFSAEYWTFSCTAWNDFYLALLDNAAPNIPADKNISFDGFGNPLSVNNGFYDLCVPKGCYSCPAGTAQLQGTGMQLSNTGGGTLWLQTNAPVVPGETMVLQLMVFDVSDDILDSLALLDNFAWSIMPSSVGTGPPG